MQYSPEHSGLNLLLLIRLAGSLLRKKQRGFTASCISFLLPCSLVYHGHKGSFPALALCCPLSLSKSTERSVWFSVILPFPSLLFPLHSIQPETVKLEDLRRLKQMPPYSFLHKAIWHISSPAENGLRVVWICLFLP